MDDKTKIALGEAFRTVSNAEFRVNQAMKELDKMMDYLRDSKNELIEAGLRITKLRTEQE